MLSYHHHHHHQTNITIKPSSPSSSSHHIITPPSSLMVLGSRGISAILCIANNLEEWKSKCADAQVSCRHFSKEVSESISVLEFGSIGKLKQPDLGAQVLRLMEQEPLQSKVWVQILSPLTPWSMMLHNRPLRSLDWEAWTWLPSTRALPSSQCEVPSVLHTVKFTPRFTVQLFKSSTGRAVRPASG